MQINKFILLSCLLSCCTFACQKIALMPSDYIKWIENEKNGLRKTKIISHFNITVQYQPISYIVACEAQSNELSKEVLQKRASELKGSQYFKLELSVDDKDPNKNITNYNVLNQQEFQQRMHYLSFDMQKDIQLVEGNDTIPCTLYHFERALDLQPSRTFVVAFEEKEVSTHVSKTLIIDASLFQAGIIKVQFDATVFQNLPNIKLKS